MTAQQDSHAEWSASSALLFGDFGLVAEQESTVDLGQLEALRREFMEQLPSEARVWIRPVRNKMPDEDTLSNPLAMVRPGDPLLEIDGVSQLQARELLLSVRAKLPIACSLALDPESQQGTSSPEPTSKGFHRESL